MGRFARLGRIYISLAERKQDALAGPMGPTAVEPMHNASIYPQIVQQQHESRGNALSHAASKPRIGAVIFRDELTVHGRITYAASQLTIEELVHGHCQVPRLGSASVCGMPVVPVVDVQ